MKKLLLIPLFLTPLWLAALSPVNRTLIWNEPTSEQLPDAYILYSSKTMKVPANTWLPLMTMPGYQFNQLITNSYTVSLTYKDTSWHAIIWNNDLAVQQTNDITPTLAVTLQMDPGGKNYFYLVASNVNGLSVPSNFASVPAIPTNQVLKIR